MVRIVSTASARMLRGRWAWQNPRLSCHFVKPLLQISRGNNCGRIRHPLRLSVLFVGPLQVFPIPSVNSCQQNSISTAMMALDRQGSHRSDSVCKGRMRVHEKQPLHRHHHHHHQHHRHHVALPLPHSLPPPLNPRGASSPPVMGSIGAAAGVAFAAPRAQPRGSPKDASGALETKREHR